MKIIIKLVSAVLLIFMTQTVEAQFLNKLKDRVKYGVEEAVLRKTEDKAVETTESAMDSIFTAPPKTTQNSETKNNPENGDVSAETNPQADADNMLGGLLGGGGEVKTNDAYTFDITADIMVENYTKKKVETNKVIQSYGKDATCNVVEEAPGPLISDFVNNTTIMLNEETKVAQVMSMDWLINMMPDEPENEEIDVTVTKTGKTKTLNGYDCHEYLIQTEDSDVYGWYAPDVPFSYEDYLSGFSKMFGIIYSHLPN